MKKQNNIAHFLKEIMYGGMDGIVTTFAVVAGFSGANSGNLALSSSLVLLFGFANLFADATSMGLGNFLSVRSDNANNHKRQKPALTSIATFLSFLAFGFIPLVPYLIFDSTNKNLFLESLLFTIIALVFLAVVRSKVTHEKPISVIIEVLLIGGTASLVAYFVGTMFKS